MQKVISDFSRNRLFTAFMALALVVLVGVPFTLATQTSTASNTTLSTDVIEPFTKGMSVSYVDPETGVSESAASNSFRIPAMVTLADGTMVAAADVRWNTTYDGGGLDTLAAYSSNGGASWSYATANYLGDNGNVYNGSSSSCFIDPCLTVAKDGQTVYMLVDLYPYGVALNGTDKVNPVAATGFDSNGNLLLSDDNHSTYGYYLSGGTIYSAAGEAVEGYTVDSYFNITGTDGTDSNLFFEDSPYQVTRTGFLYLTKSTDGGVSWSAPQLLNVGRESSSEWVTLVAPGSGLTTSEGVMIFPVYSFYGDNDPSGNTQRMSFIYSSDGVNWTRSVTRSVSSADWASESAVVELSDGTLRFFFRNGSTNLCYVDYTFGGGWGTYVNTGLDTNSNCQISAITHSQTIDGKQVILVSCPTGPSETGSNLSSASARLNGKIFAFTVESDNTLTKISETSVTSGDAPFMYSCLAERADGSVAILYENMENAWGTGDNCYYTMDMKAYAASDLDLTFDDEGDESGGETGSVVVTDEGTGVSVTVDSPILTGLLVGKAAVSDGRFAEGKVLAYDVKPTKEGGLYTEAATVTIPIPDGWTEDRVRAFIVESDGSVNLISGEVTELGYSYRAPHFSVTGIAETAADVTLQVGESSSLMIDGAYYTAGQVQLSDGSVASVSVESQEAVEGGTATEVKYDEKDVSCGDLIGSNSGSWRATGYYYTPDDGENYYPLYAQRSGYGGSNRTYTWGYSTDEGVSVKTIGSQRNSASTVPNIAVYSQTETTVTTPAQDAYTKLTFIGLLPGTATVTAGNEAYTVLVTAKSVSKSVSLKTGATAELNPLDDLGFASNSGYAVAYSLDGGEDVVSVSDGAVTAGSSKGVATVVATVSSGDVAVGTVEYAITVADVVVTDVESIYVPVGRTATIEGLSGDIYKGLLDEGIATVTPASGTISNDDLVIAGVAEGMTTVIVGNTQINVYVAPANTGSGAGIPKYIYIYVEEMDHCTVYYAINGGTLDEVEGTGVLIDQTYGDGFNIMFFAKPDDGYALTVMSATGSATDGNQGKLSDFYALSNGTASDGSDSDAWPFDNASQTSIPTSSSDSAWVEGHGFRWCLLEGNMSIADMRDLFTRALKLECDGATTITKNSTEDFYGNFVFMAEKLPTLEKSIVSYQRNGTTYDYDPDTSVLEFGDVLTYSFTVTSSSPNVSYSNIRLNDELIGYTQSLSDFSGETVLTYEAVYTVNAEDASEYQNGSIVNTAMLTYAYSSGFSNGTYSSASSASATAMINGLVSYVWASDVPAGIAGDAVTYPLPTSHYQQYNTQFNVANASYDAYVGNKDGVEGVWTFKGWTYGGTAYQGGDAVTMPASGSVTFVGNWTFTPSLASLTIKKSVTDNDVDDGDSFLFKVTNDSGALVAEVVLTGEDVKAGKGVTVEGLQIGASYTVAEDTDWSWRYDVEDPVSGKKTVTVVASGNEVTFTNAKTKNTKWLDFSGWCENLFVGTGAADGIGYELD